MRVLLTGASGFIGRHSVPVLLKKGHEVHAVSFSKPGENQRNLYWHQSDLLAPKQVQELIETVSPSHLLHFAWYTEHGKFWNSLENFRWVQASLELLQLFANNGGQRAVVAGSCAEYDWNHALCAELTTPLIPETVYGGCKHALQIMLSCFSKETGLSSAWGRIFHVYGPHENPERLVASVIRSLLLGKEARCTHGEQIRDFLHVAKAAAAFVELLESTVEGPVNIASGHPVALKDLILEIGKRIGNPNLIRLGAIGSRQGEPLMLCADITRLRDEVRWTLSKSDAKNDMDSTIQWWREKLMGEAVEAR
jgi:nucleoside-diphosphate-sugar epimerase